jgi:hypothetical protein
VRKRPSRDGRRRKTTHDQSLSGAVADCRVAERIRRRRRHREANRVFYGRAPDIAGHTGMTMDEAREMAIDFAKLLNSLSGTGPPDECPPWSETP